MSKRKSDEIVLSSDSDQESEATSSTSGPQPSAAVGANNLRDFWLNCDHIRQGLYKNNNLHTFNIYKIIL